MERGLVMLVHSAEDRSVLLGAVVLIYMVLFGHRLPGTINRNVALF